MDPGLAGAAAKAPPSWRRASSSSSRASSPNSPRPCSTSCCPNYLAPIPSAALVEGDAALRRRRPDRRQPLRARRLSRRGLCRTASAASPAASVCGSELDPLAAPSGGGRVFRGAAAAAGARPGNRCRASPPGCASAFGAGTTKLARRQAGRHSPRRAGQANSRSTRCRSISLARQVDAIALYEQLFANCRRITLRYLDEFGDPHFVALPPDLVEPDRFRRKARRCSDSTTGSSAAFNLLRDFFAFPQNFLGFRLEGLRRPLSPGRRRMPSTCLFEFDTAIPRLASVVKPGMLRALRRDRSPICSRCSAAACRCAATSASTTSSPTAAAGWISRRRVLDVFAHYTGPQGEGAGSFRSTACRPTTRRSATRSSTRHAGCRGARRCRNSARRADAAMSASEAVPVAARTGGHRRAASGCASSASARWCPTAI